MGRPRGRPRSIALTRETDQVGRSCARAGDSRVALPYDVTPMVLAGRLIRLERLILRSKLGKAGRARKPRVRRSFRPT